MTGTRTKAKRIVKSVSALAAKQKAQKAQQIDQREEIKSNEIKLNILMPGGTGWHQIVIDASQFDTPEKVVDEVRAILLRLLTA